MNEETLKRIEQDGKLAAHNSITAMDEYMTVCFEEGYKAGAIAERNKVIDEVKNQLEFHHVDGNEYQFDIRFLEQLKLKP